MTAERLAIFDLDGTLLDSLPDLADCARELLAEYHLPSQNDLAVRSMIGDGVAALVSRLLDTGGEEAAHINREEAAIRAFQQLLYLNPCFSCANEAHLRLGFMLKVVGEYKASLKHYQLALLDISPSTFTQLQNVTGNTNEIKVHKLHFHTFDFILHICMKSRTNTKRQRRHMNNFCMIRN
ncbi:phosphoglycolate phosphatase, chromosomal-like [Teleopsis dalmanni]|uniref:phosphoglycolate phosphatase, chromosomal-like n=1 Tax=Teleopsis dalmanni TaxID=139649 RepID=UPI0018CF3D34|nr:phosphoglycolate phosphatase, chromosomal-like [Teleopsis dalmanni]